MRVHVFINSPSPARRLPLRHWNFARLPKS
jgi:hypothetical protein